MELLSWLSGAGSAEPQIHPELPQDIPHTLPNGVLWAGCGAQPFMQQDSDLPPGSRQGQGSPANEQNTRLSWQVLPAKGAISGGCCLTQTCSNCHKRQTHLSRFFESIEPVLGKTEVLGLPGSERRVSLPCSSPPPQSLAGHISQKFWRLNQAPFPAAAWTSSCSAVIFVLQPMLAMCAGTGFFMKDQW